MLLVERFSRVLFSPMIAVLMLHRDAKGHPTPLARQAAIFVHRVLNCEEPWAGFYKMGTWRGFSIESGALSDDDIEAFLQEWEYIEGSKATSIGQTGPLTIAVAPNNDLS